VGMGRVGGDGEWTMWTGWERNGKESRTGGNGVESGTKYFTVSASNLGII